MSNQYYVKSDGTLLVLAGSISSGDYDSDHITCPDTVSGELANFTTSLTMLLESIFIDAAAVKITRCGKNLVQSVISGCDINASGELVASASYSMALAPVKSGKTYTLTTDGAQFVGGYFSGLPSVGAVTYDSQKIESSTKTVTAPIDGFIAFRIGLSYATAQFEVGSSATAYEAYNGAEYLPADKDTITTLAGVNNIWANTGTVDITYLETLTEYASKKLN